MRLGASNIDEAMVKVNASMERFGASQHSGSKGSHFRKALGDHRDSIQKNIHDMAAIGHAVGAFPSAAPVSLIFTVANGLLSVRRNQ